MSMKSIKKIGRYWRQEGRTLIWLGLGCVALVWLLFNRLASLTHGFSPAELKAATTPVGWHGVFQHPLDLPLQLVRSVVFFVTPEPGLLAARLPNAFFGVLAIVSFGWLVWLWHGRRTMILATLLFATAAWTLHVSRFVSFDVLYLWAMPTFLLIQLRLQQGIIWRFDWYACLLGLVMMLFIPGFVWFLILGIYLQRKALLDGWRSFSNMWERALTIGIVAIWLPLLLIDLVRHGELRQWLGLPAHFSSNIFEQFVTVPVHLLVRGPKSPDLWLGRAPILDAFVLACAIIGIYFYASRWRSKRSRLLAAVFAIGWLLVSLGGPVGLSVLVPLMYLAAATGIAYLLHDWLKVFPRNPLARGLGVSIIAVAVLASCVYNFRAYFVAWPHNVITEATFRYHR
jgi:hypothetical protein